MSDDDDTPRCTARNSRGERCRRRPINGGTVCATHGGRAPQVVAAAARRLEAAAASELVARSLAEAFGDSVPEVDPAEAMLSAVSWKYSEVVFLRQKVAGLKEKEMVWGKTRVKTGGDDYGTTKEARANIWWQMLRTAEEQLVRFAAAARSAGCDERRVRLAEQQGLMLASVVRRILDRLQLTEEQQGLVPVVVPEELRAIEGGQG